ncbi:hypothetical protein CGLO_14317 [Colletotrichum gloeosporioides Cg-14]|uniref:Uncharacterized protein n=1 Tax=Colletotrichum gloeosporioides (strain Cg-14) TaxID=1237896 RepID=T0K1M7_COLGC|nr:hypothetical protein CGLO_14317 [Colletotrichum gloeosporioides Cg-14]
MVKKANTLKSYLNACKQ